MDILLVVVTLISLAVAGTMSFVAWRVVRDERRRSETRVAALAAAIPPAEPDHPSGAGAPVSSQMFTFMQPVTALPRLAAVVIAGVLVVGVGAVLLVAVGSTGRAPGTSAEVGAAGASRATALPAAGALELMALGHEREGDRLTVRGLVRNPVGGPSVTALTAVVVAYDREGGFMATGRALAQTSTLGPGGESPFLVTVTGVADVGRYRVSFRSGDRVVSHVDIRS
jgi:hypothetical protein